MSREAWGDEGNVATHWEDTLMRSEMDKTKVAFIRWRNSFKDDFPGPDFEALVDRVLEAFDDLQTELSGEI